MKHNRVEIMIHGKDISFFTVSLGGAQGVKLIKTEKAESPNYLFVTIEISPKAKPQTVSIIFKRGNEKFAKPFPILA